MALYSYRNGAQYATEVRAENIMVRNGKKNRSNKYLYKVNCSFAETIKQAKFNWCAEYGFYLK